MTGTSWTEKDLREAALAYQRDNAARVMWRLEQRAKRKKSALPDPPSKTGGI